ncbi:MAG: hypothetical protein PVI23_14920 [Maricaulaceae bacterium]
MKRFLIAAASVTALAAPAAADSSTYSVDIYGDVSPFCEAINDSISAVETLSALDGTLQSLGDVTYRCNLPDGFQRTVTSTNGGQLSGPEGLTIDYSLSHSGAPSIAFPATQLTAPLVDSRAGSYSLALGQTGTVSASAVAGTFLWAGVYTDTVELEIAAN